VRQNLPSFDEETKNFAREAFVQLRYPNSKDVLIHEIFSRMLNCDVVVYVLCYLSSECLIDDSLPSKGTLEKLRSGASTTELRKELENEKCIIQ
jgi:hypothetical protein